jgi:hypothetical protein
MRALCDEAMRGPFDETIAALVEAVRTLVNVCEGQGEALWNLRQYKADQELGGQVFTGRWS